MTVRTTAVLALVASTALPLRAQVAAGGVLWMAALRDFSAGAG